MHYTFSGFTRMNAENVCLVTLLCNDNRFDLFFTCHSNSSIFNLTVFRWFWTKISSNKPTDTIEKSTSGREQFVLGYNCTLISPKRFTGFSSPITQKGGRIHLCAKIIWSAKKYCHLHKNIAICAFVHALTKTKKASAKCSGALRHSKCQMRFMSFHLRKNKTICGKINPSAEKCNPSAEKWNDLPKRLIVLQQNRSIMLKQCIGLL